MKYCGNTESCPRLRRGALLLVAVLAVVVRPALAQVAARTEYEVKAEFLPLFSLFVAWPAVVSPTGDVPIVVGVLGEDPFGSALDKAVQKEEQLHDRKFVLRRGRDIEALMPCHILFICKSERDKLAKILARTERESILTVGDMDGFVAMGGVINFFIKEGRVRFEISAEAAKQKGLKINCQLLSLGRRAGS